MPKEWLAKRQREGLGDVTIPKAKWLLAFVLPTVGDRKIREITNSQGAGPLLRAIDGFDGHEVTRLALRFAPHVFGQSGDLRHAEWSEVDFDQAIWSIPADKTKMRRPHRVWLDRLSMMTTSPRPGSGSGTRTRVT